MPRTNEIHLTELDAARLERAVIAQLQREELAAQGTAELEDILDSAAVVPSAAIGPQVVTMNSTVVVEEPESRARTTLTLVYPGDADPECSRISVLSPVASVAFSMTWGINALLLAALPVYLLTALALPPAASAAAASAEEVSSA